MYSKVQICMYCKFFYSVSSSTLVLTSCQTCVWANNGHHVSQEQHSKFITQIYAAINLHTKNRGCWWSRWYLLVLDSSNDTSLESVSCKYDTVLFERLQSRLKTKTRMFVPTNNFSDFICVKVNVSILVVWLSLDLLVVPHSASLCDKCANAIPNDQSYWRD